MVFRMISSISNTPNLNNNCNISIIKIPVAEANSNLSKRFNCLWNVIGNRNPKGINTTIFPMILIINGVVLLLLYSMM